MPETIKTLGNDAFATTKLTEISYLPDSIREIGYRCFYNMPCLTKITIGSGCSKIGLDVFKNTPLLTEVHIRATTPPAIDGNTFRGVVEDLKIYVPTGSKQYYDVAANWSAIADRIVEE